MFFVEVRRAVMMIPPPLFYVAAFALGLLVERWAPAPTRFVFAEGAVVARTLVIVACTSILLGVVLGPLNAIRFLIRRTTLNPNKRATVFLTQGMYRISRNPMYLGLFLIYVGIALLNGKLWPLATIVIPFFVVDRIIIPFEESQMLDRYGSTYREYCSRVGRWLTLQALTRRETR
jgi:protein-S-isoprenylcysteine O-methyltransferase Ste14